MFLVGVVGVWMEPANGIACSASESSTPSLESSFISMSGDRVGGATSFSFSRLLFLILPTVFICLGINTGFFCSASLVDETLVGVATVGVALLVMGTGVFLRGMLNS